MCDACNVHNEVPSDLLSALCDTRRPGRGLVNLHAVFRSGRACALGDGDGSKQSRNMVRGFSKACHATLQFHRTRACFGRDAIDASGASVHTSASGHGMAVSGRLCYVQRLLVVVWAVGLGLDRLWLVWVWVWGLLVGAGQVGGWAYTRAIAAWGLVQVYLFSLFFARGVGGGGGGGVCRRSGTVGRRFA